MRSKHIDSSKPFVVTVAEPIDNGYLINRSVEAFYSYDPLIPSPLPPSWFAVPKENDPDEDIGVFYLYLSRVA